MPERTIWLPHGLALDDDTDGHVDNIAAFAAPGHLVLQGCDDRDEDDWLRLDVDRRVASGSVDARGRALDVTVIPVLPFAEVAGERVVVPYLNYYVGNGFVVVPTCGHAADADMVDMIGSLYPGRDGHRAGRRGDARLRGRRDPLHHPAGPCGRVTESAHVATHRVAAANADRRRSVTVRWCR